MFVYICYVRIYLLYVSIYFHMGWKFCHQPQRAHWCESKPFIAAAAVSPGNCKQESVLQLTWWRCWGTALCRMENRFRRSLFSSPSAELKQNTRGVQNFFSRFHRHRDCSDPCPVCQGGPVIWEVGQGLGRLWFANLKHASYGLMTSRSDSIFTFYKRYTNYESNTYEVNRCIQ